MASDLLEMSAKRLRLNEHGRLMSNEVFQRFLRNNVAEERALVMVD
jgi:coproporphyrinogen III oxidase-like Fe-S oxidoreductase